MRYVKVRGRTVDIRMPWTTVQLELPLSQNVHLMGAASSQKLMTTSPGLVAYGCNSYLTKARDCMEAREEVQDEKGCQSW